MIQSPSDSDSKPTSCALPLETTLPLSTTDTKRTDIKNKGIVVFSGGSAANSLVDVFNKIVEEKDCDLSYVIPISDNGGSSSELIRFFGGPGISSSMCTS
jgi:2-phospho-L-lactate transferase CofD